MAAGWLCPAFGRSGLKGDGVAATATRGCSHLEVGGVYSGVSALVNNNPVWAPDGERIPFRSDRDGGFANLHVQAISGTGEAERVTNSSHLQDTGYWSPDGKLVASMSFPGHWIRSLDRGPGRGPNDYALLANGVQ